MKLLALVVGSFLVVILVTSCASTPSSSVPPTATKPAVQKSGIEPKARAVLEALKRRDWVTFATYMHPRLGVCFAPSPEACRKAVTKKQVLDLASSGKKRVWGEYDGSGDPIELTLNDFAERFLYDRDFLIAPEVNRGKYVFRGGNLHDPTTGRKRTELIEFHFPRTGDSPDWKSLTLVFESEGTDWFVSVIQHDEWTI